MDLDAIFEGTPEERFFEIMGTADPLVVQEELTRLIDRMATLELMLEADLEELDKQVRQFQFERAAEVEASRRNYLIGAMAQIVSSHER